MMVISIKYSNNSNDDNYSTNNKMINEFDFDSSKNNKNNNNYNRNNKSIIDYIHYIIISMITMIITILTAIIRTR